MTIISRVVFLAAVAAVGLASPAFAGQSGQNKMAARASGLNAYASVPRASAGSESNDPAVTGGGSAGYNQLLKNF